MSLNRTLWGRILTSTGWMDGVLSFSANGRITDIIPHTLSQEQANCLILPGFIDLHVHGGGGADIMEGADSIEPITRTHARYGTTALLATTMTAPQEEITQVLQALGQSCQLRCVDGARLLGVHLEGPYINPDKLGAQPAHACQATRQQVDAYCKLAPIKLITLAPEITGHMDIIHYLKTLGIKVQIGHTLGSYEETMAALQQGASGFTHLFNAMTGLHHRTPGVVGAALAHAEYAELIPDLLHVHPGAIRVALRAIPRLYCVTDSTAAAGMPDGEYKLGSQTVTKCLGGVRLANGTLAGSTLTMDQALRNLVSLGLSVEDASHRLSRYPAEYIGISDRGFLAPGAWADLVIMTSNLHLQQVFIEGVCLDLTHA